MLSDAANGVLSDIRPGAAKELVSGTSPGSDDAFLVLDATKAHPTAMKAIGGQASAMAALIRLIDAFI